jgi:osmotically inducible protein OsmC
MKSTASAVWEGGLKDGKGQISAEGGALKATPYSFAKRFEGQGAGTTPEELLAAAHAGCYAIATSSGLGNAGFTPNKLEVTCTVTMEPMDGKPTVKGSHLVLKASVPGIDEAKFKEIAETMRSGCVISRALGVPITLDATLAR